MIRTYSMLESCDTMKQSLYLLFLLLMIVESCAQESKQKNPLTIDTANVENVPNRQEEPHLMINPSGNTLETRILPPANFIRTLEEVNSFPQYLRELPLKPDGAEVALYDGTTKPNYMVYDAVVDLRIGNKNLHQCADAVMRLRAEYLWRQQRYEDIHFNFTNGFRVDYSKWMAGNRMVVEGNKTYWKEQSTPSNTYQDFWSYMELIFNYAGTLSLSKELVSVEISDMKIGDVFIRGGSPGHAIIVIDMAQHPTSKEKIFLLAQSYMPAQETQILKNPNNTKLSPWYAVSEIEEELITPEWTFKDTELKRFEE